VVALAVCPVLAWREGVMAMMDPIQLGPALIHEAADRLQDKLLELGAKPALQPTIERLRDNAPARVQLYVPYCNEPRALTAQDIDDLAMAIVEHTKAPTFYRLELPEGFGGAARIESKAVSCRYIEAEDIQWGERRCRLDVLFDAEDDG
jgi:hypothetical protein